jgi:small subunit ribosomal protein S16
MPVRIRLRRMGRKKHPHYRVVVADSASPRDGRFVETLGYYKPLTKPARLILDLERVDHWIGEGALPSGTVKSLIAKARRGGDASVALGEVDPETREAKRAEALATRRAEEARATQAKAEAEAAAAAEAKAAAEAEAAPEDAGENQAADSAEASE